MTSVAVAAAATLGLVSDPVVPRTARAVAGQSLGSPLSDQKMLEMPPVALRALRAAMISDKLGLASV
jgi:hypothetical protein